MSDLKKNCPNAVGLQPMQRYLDFMLPCRYTEKYREEQARNLTRYVLRIYVLNFCYHSGKGYIKNLTVVVILKIMLIMLVMDDIMSEVSIAHYFWNKVYP